MPLISPVLKEALAQGKAFAVFEFDDPGGTTHKYAGGWISSDSLGIFKGFIPPGGWGKSPRAVSLRGDRLQNVSTSVVINDDDGVIKDLVTGQYARSIRGLDSRIRIVAPNIDADAFHLRFQGQLLNYAKTDRKQYRFDLGTKAPELDSFLNVPTITKATWPDADAGALGKRCPLVAGVHDSSSLGSRGMLPVQYVDTVNYKYLVSHQYIKSIDNVFIDHIVQGSGWAEENVFIEGERYTLVDFDSDRSANVITVDATGMTEDGDPTSDVIENPVAQFVAFLANYVFNSWNGVPANRHDTTDSPLRKDLLDVAESFMNYRGQEGSISITEKLTGMQFINKWSAQFLPAYWMPDATLAIRADPWYQTVADWDADRNVFLENEHFKGPLSYLHSDEILKDEWSVGFLYSQADKTALERIRVKDTLRSLNISDELDLDYMLSKA